MSIEGSLVRANTELSKGKTAHRPEPYRAKPQANLGHSRIILSPGTRFWLDCMNPSCNPFCSGQTIASANHMTNVRLISGLLSRAPCQQHSPMFPCPVRNCLAGSRLSSSNRKVFRTSLFCRRSSSLRHVFCRPAKKSKYLLLADLLALLVGHVCFSPTSKKVFTGCKLVLSLSDPV